MDIALFDRQKKSCVPQHRSKIRSNQSSNGYDRRRPLTSFHHGRPLTYARAPRSGSRPCAGKPSKDMKQMLASWQGQALSTTVFQFEYPENDDYVNSRFRFVIRDGPAVDEDGEVPWDRVEHVRVPTFDHSYACPICLDSPVAARITRCGHVFCFPCLLHHLHERPKCKCPLCFAFIDENELRSMEFDKIKAVHVGDEVEMCLLMRHKSHTHPQPADPNRAETFSRFVRTKSIEPIIEKELFELKAAADSCQCVITAAFINLAITAVESRFSRWATVPHEEDVNDTQDDRDPFTQGRSPDEMYFFYQNFDGSPVFMHSLNYRSLVEEYETEFPSVIRGKVVDVLQYEQTEENRSRFRFLRHLPISTIFYIVELDISEYLSEKTLDKFRDETATRRLAREEKRRQLELIERRQERRAQLMELEKRQSLITHYQYEPYPVPEVGSMESFPTLSSTPPFRAHVATYGGRMTPSQDDATPTVRVHPYSDEDSDSENGQLLHSFTPPDWNLIDFQITTKSKQKKQKSKNRQHGADGP